MSKYGEHFDADLQQKILSLMMQDRYFLARVYPFIQPYYFDSEVMMDLVKITKDYYNNYGVNPSALSLMTETKLFLQSTKRKNSQKYFDIISECFSDKLPEKDYINHIAIDFVREKEAMIALSKSVDFLDNGQYDQIKKMMDKAFSISEIDKPVLRYRSPEVIRGRWQKDDKFVMPTGWPELDKHLDDGGIGIGEIGLVVGFTSIGKSIILVMLGANSLKMRKKVLHISLENSKRKTEKRYDRNLFGKTKNMIMDNVRGLEDFLQTMFDSYKCDLIVEKFPPGVLKPSELKAYIINLKTIEEFEPDLVIVDSPYLMKAEYHRERPDIELGETIMLLRGMGEELGFPIWGGAQTVQSAEDKKRVKISDVGKAHSQSENADILLLTSRTEEEKREHYLRIELGKNRDEQSGVSLRYKCMWDTMSWRFDPEGT